METFEQWWDRVGNHEDLGASGSIARLAWDAARSQSRRDKTDKAEALSDWEKVQNGETPFKIFADKWMPYLFLS